MTQKPKIQYIGQFYVPGSEAQVLAPKEKKKKAKTRLPIAKREKVGAITIDPIAVAGIAAAAVLLAVMVLGVLQIRDDWAEYNTMSRYVSQLKTENAELKTTYRAGYDLEDVQNKALGIGLIPKEECQTMTITVTVPQREPEPTFWDDVVWFFQGLFKDS